MRRAVRVSLVLVVVLGVVTVSLWGLQRRLVYLPAGAPPPVEEVLPSGQAVTLEPEDGPALEAWWVPGGPTAVVVFPGNAGNRGVRAPLAEALHDRGLSVLLVDYRGYGGNPGSPSEDGLLADGRAARAWVDGQPTVEDVVLFGESLGAAVAVALAREQPPAALVLRSPFTSLLDVARVHYGPVPSFLLWDRFPADELVAEVAVPTLVVLGEDDRIVPPDQSRRLASLAGGPTRVVEVPDAGHNDRALLDGPVLLDAVAAFLADHDLLDP